MRAWSQQTEDLSLRSRFHNIESRVVNTNKTSARKSILACTELAGPPNHCHFIRLLVFAFCHVPSRHWRKNGKMYVPLWSSHRSCSGLLAGGLPPVILFVSDQACCRPLAGLMLGVDQYSGLSLEDGDDLMLETRRDSATGAHRPAYGSRRVIRLLRAVPATKALPSAPVLYSRAESGLARLV
jgi:hypothetical protein